MHPQGLRRLQALLGQLGELDDHVLPCVAGHIVHVAHVDASCRAWLATQSAEHAFGVVDGVAGHGPTLGETGRLVQLARPGLVDVDAVHRTGLGALVTSYALLDFVEVNPPEPLLDRGSDIRVLNRHRLGETVLG